MGRGFFPALPGRDSVFPAWFNRRAMDSSVFWFGPAANRRRLRQAMGFGSTGQDGVMADLGLEAADKDSGAGTIRNDDARSLEQAPQDSRERSLVGLRQPPDCGRR